MKSRDRNIAFAWIAGILLGAPGCGYLSNDHFFDGVGAVRGRLLLDGGPAAGALVFVLDEEGVLEKVGTDEQGRFDLRARAGRERVLVGLWGAALGVQRAFSLAGEGEVDLGALDLVSVGEIQGSVRGTGLDPRAVEVRVAGSELVIRPDADGSFRLLLPAGSWSLELAAAGYERVRLDGVRAGSGSVTLSSEVDLAPDPAYVCEGSQLRVDRYSQGGGGAVDVLFVIDNSGSMVGEQIQLGESFSKLVELLQPGGVDYRIAVVTTGLRSEGCPDCEGQIVMGCMNATGETGRFQDRLGKVIDPDADPPVFEFQDAPECRIIGPDNLSCFYDPVEERGVALVGVNGCGYERGLAAMRLALEDPQQRADFLRPWSRLAVVVISDDGDCGEVGDVSESIPMTGAGVCYYSSKGIGPDGSSFHPDDPDRRPYVLTPVDSYAEFLSSLKPVSGLVTFSAVVGLEDPDDPDSTEIRYAGVDPSAGILEACQTPDCTGLGCSANPGPRYVQLARMTHGAVETICQTDFSDTLARVVDVSVGFKRNFALSAEPLAPEAISVRVEGEARSNWSWSPERRAVMFGSGSEPAAYAAVEIEYEAACP
ncbi:MAG: hypothetical protein JXR96_13045 [Deltaproteobacteria bacterium]|nr:hypothetical protein [Deltaproteobacteria bacterium]